MRNKFHYLTLLFPCFVFGYSLDSAAGEVYNYFAQYRQAMTTDYAREAQLLSGYNLEKLLEELSPFFSDSLPAVRQKAYYLTYKKAQRPSVNRAVAVERLVNGLNDAAGGTVGQLLGYLREFSPVDFNTVAQAIILARLRNTKIPHYGDLARLAGYLGIGEDVLYGHYLAPELPVKDKWNIALALARMGKAEELEYCMKKIKSLPTNNDLVNYALPDLIYTRQKQAIDYGVQLLYNDEKECDSPNPDLSESFPCGYRIMELLAPVIAGFPVKTDITGQLETDDYAGALQTVRKWLADNTGYTIKKDSY
jgi:hypothetical protein